MGGLSGVADGEGFANCVAINVDCRHAVVGGGEDLSEVESLGNLLNGFDDVAFASARVTSEKELGWRKCCGERGHVRVWSAMGCFFEFQKMVGHSFDSLKLFVLEVSVLEQMMESLLVANKRAIPVPLSLGLPGFGSWRVVVFVVGVVGVGEGCFDAASSFFTVDAVWPLRSDNFFWFGVDFRGGVGIVVCGFSRLEDFFESSHLAVTTAVLKKGVSDGSARENLVGFSIEVVAVVLFGIPVCVVAVSGF